MVHEGKLSCFIGAFMLVLVEWPSWLFQGGNFFCVFLEENLVTYLNSPEQPLLRDAPKKM